MDQNPTKDQSQITRVTKSKTSFSLLSLGNTYLNKATGPLYSTEIIKAYLQYHQYPVFLPAMNVFLKQTNSYLFHLGPPVQNITSKIEVLGHFLFTPVYSFVVWGDWRGKVSFDLMEQCVRWPQIPEAFKQGLHGTRAEGSLRTSTQLDFSAMTCCKSRKVFLKKPWKLTETSDTLGTL